MKNYKYLLFDADNTLFDFNKCENEAFRLAVSRCVDYTDEIYSLYHVINDNLWKLLEKGGTTRDELKVERYRQFFEAIGRKDVDYRRVAKSYEGFLAEQSFEIPECFEVLSELSGRFDMYVITNGITHIQQSRFSASRFTPLLKKIFISEQMGASKPSERFFDIVVADIGDSDLSHYLVIGDSLTSDIDGAIRYGIDSCWFNPSGASRDGRDVTYEIGGMKELLSILD